MSLISCDVESDGPIISINSMVCFGAIIVEPSLSKTFYGKVKPISTQYNPEALAISGFTRKEHGQFDDPFNVMPAFAKWIKENSNNKPVFISDNNGYDFSWINYYLLVYNNGDNPFGHSSRRIGDLYCGMKMDAGVNRDWKKLRRTRHSHNPIDDCKGNAEAILAMKRMGLKINLI